MLPSAEIEILSAREQRAASDAQMRQATAVLFEAIGGGWTGPAAGHRMGPASDGG